MAKEQTNERPEVREEFKITPKLINLEGTVTPIQDVLEEIMPTGRQVKTEDILGEKIVIRDLKPVMGASGPFFFTVATTSSGEIINVSLGGGALVEKLAAIQERLPVSCTIVKAEGGRFGWYYDFE